MGLASLLPHPIWPDQDVLDLFFHPSAWNRATGLMERLAMKSGRSCVSYTDIGATNKAEILSATGFARVATLPGWLSDHGDVAVWRRG